MIVEDQASALATYRTENVLANVDVVVGGSRSQELPRRESRGATAAESRESRRRRCVCGSHRREPRKRAAVRFGTARCSRCSLSCQPRSRVSSVTLVIYYKHFPNLAARFKTRVIHAGTQLACFHRRTSMSGGHSLCSHRRPFMCGVHPTALSQKVGARRQQWS